MPGPGGRSRANRLIGTNVERVPKRLRRGADAERGRARARPVDVATARIDGRRTLWRPRCPPRRRPRPRRRAGPDPRRACARLTGPPASGHPARHHHPDPARTRRWCSQLLEDLRTVARLAAGPLAALLRARAARGWRRHDQADALGEEDHAALDAAIGWAVGHRHPDSYLAAFAERAEPGLMLCASRTRPSSWRRSMAPRDASGRRWWCSASRSIDSRTGAR